MADIDWTKYEQLRDQGLSEHKVHNQAIADGFSPIQCIRMLREVFGVDLCRAKEIHIQADGFQGSLDEYQASLVPMIEEALRDIEDEEGNSGSDS